MDIKKPEEKVGEKSKITTIKIAKDTKKRMEHLRLYHRETYDDIMKRILEILNLCRVEPARAQGRLFLLDKERKRNIRQGNDNHEARY